MARLAAVWHPCHTRDTRKPVRNIAPETLGFEGSETAGRHGHVNRSFPEDLGETQRLCNGNGFETDIVILFIICGPWEEATANSKRSTR